MLVITLGDPYSVSIELLADLLSEIIKSPEGPSSSPLSPRLLGEHLNLPVVVIGSLFQWNDQCRRLGHLGHDFIKLKSVQELAAKTQNDVKKSLYFVDIGTPEMTKPAEKMTSKDRGLHALLALQELKKLPTQGPLAVLTCPIDKAACKEAGFTHDGHTEYFQEIWKANAIMLLAGPRLRVGLVTNHASLSDVTKLISSELIQQKVLLLHQSLKRFFDIKDPRIAVASINPHVGDSGLFGFEDEQIVRPAIETLCKTDPSLFVKGPLPADSVFFKAYHGEYDAVLAMYHDQGLGPLKTVHFESAVNISGGLPHLRISPCHGPARDLFLRRLVSPESMRQALTICIDYLSQK